jgi:DNA-directed RNA polymerase sigma subunit (sigma70/sigma32)
LGDRLGVSKERIRQLQERALNKLRGVASRERIDLPDI